MDGTRASLQGKRLLITGGTQLFALRINLIVTPWLAAFGGLIRALIQPSANSVYSRRKANDEESDLSDAEDLHDKSRYIGYVNYQPHVISLRTSHIRHELNSRNGLLEWFLSQEREGSRVSRRKSTRILPSAELARVRRQYVLSRPKMNGLYHVWAKPIANLDLPPAHRRGRRKGNHHRAFGRLGGEPLAELEAIHATDRLRGGPVPEFIALMHANRR
jgi:dTDP-4-dehydrorhamnose reductase